MRVAVPAIKPIQSYHSGGYPEKGMRARAQALVSSRAQATSGVLKQWSNKHYLEE
jgi:hypothetical protein